MSAKVFPSPLPLLHCVDIDTSCHAIATTTAIVLDPRLLIRQSRVTIAVREEEFTFGVGRG